MPTLTKSGDLLVTGTYLLKNSRQHDVISDGGVLISGDKIAAVGLRSELKAQFPAAAELHQPYGLVMPGLINTHTHACMTCYRGLADDLPAPGWPPELRTGAEATLDRETAYRSALLCIAEMIKSGTTSFCDMSLFGLEVARAAEESGIRCWVGELLYDYPSAPQAESGDTFSTVNELLKRYLNHPLLTVTVAPHSIGRCSSELLVQSRSVADENQAVLTIHLPENRKELQACLQNHDTAPVHYLDRLGLLNERTLAVHPVFLEPEEINLLAQRGVKVSLCQESNMKNASGAAPVTALFEHGVTMSVGTDTGADNNDADMFSEMSCLAKSHKAATLDPTLMDAETTLRMATGGGGAALCAADRVGELEVGKKADLIVLDLKQPHLTPLYNIPSHLVYTARGADVVHSIINGQVVMRDRLLLLVDETEILAGMTEISERLSTFSDILPNHR